MNWKTTTLIVGLVLLAVFIECNGYGGSNTRGGRAGGGRGGGGGQGRFGGGGQGRFGGGGFGGDRSRGRVGGRGGSHRHVGGGGRDYNYRGLGNSDYGYGDYYAYGPDYYDDGGAYDYPSYYYYYAPVNTQPQNTGSTFSQYYGPSLASNILDAIKG